MARTLVGGSGWLLPAPVSPMWAIARVPLSNPAAALELSPVDCGPQELPLVAPADRRWARPAWSSSGGPGVAVVFGGTCGPAGRREGVQQVCTEQVLAQLTAFNSLPCSFLAAI